MKAMLRNFAERWADKVLAHTVDDLRRDLIRANAAVGRLNQRIGRVTSALNVATATVTKQGKLLAVAERCLADERRAVMEQAEHIRDLCGRIERQADNHEADRADWERAKSWMAARINELEQTVVATNAKAGWPDVAAVSGPQSKAYGRQ